VKNAIELALAICRLGCYPRNVRGIASIVVAICLMAASGVRPSECSGGGDTHHTSQLACAGAGVAGALVSRRDGAGPDLRIAAFTIPSVSVALAAPRAVAELCERSLHGAIDTQVPTRCARGPPRG
jgi:hypothetical protein